MTLHLLPARNERAIDAAPAAFAIEQSFHAQLLARAQPQEHYPLLHRLRYHDDAAFALAELPRLGAELQRIAARFAEPTQIRALSRFVEQAIADGNNLYACAD